MSKKDNEASSQLIGPLITGILAVILGIGLLMVSNYMRTDFTFSAAQTDWSNVVNYAGRAILVVGLILVTVCFVKRAARDLLKNQ